MPQIWITYQELADHLGLDTARARQHAIDMAYPRRHCSDDLTRIKLDPAEGLAYVATLPEVRRAIAGPTPLPLLRDIDESALSASAAAGGPDYVAGEFTDLLVARLRGVQVIAALPEKQAVAT
jgi:hypothetical protein